MSHEPEYEVCYQVAHSVAAFRGKLHLQKRTCVLILVVLLAVVLVLDLLFLPDAHAGRATAPLVCGSNCPVGVEGLWRFSHGWSFTRNDY